MASKLEMHDENVLIVYYTFRRRRHILTRVLAYTCALEDS